MRLDQLPAGAQRVLADWVDVNDIQSIIQPDPTLYCVIESHSGMKYSMTTAFQLGIAGDWVVSADVQRGTANEVLMNLGRRSE